jgi:hypothetical protein
MQNKITKIITIMIISLLTLNIGFSAESSFTDVRASLVNQNPSQVIAGDIVELRIGIENWGYQVANNIVIELEEQYPFELISDDIEEIGALQTTNNDGTNIQIVKFKLKVDSGISAGEYAVNLNIYSKDTPNIIQEETIMVDIKTKESAEIIYIDKTILIPGKQETMNFVINNVGSSELKDITFSWTNPEGIILPVGSDNSRYVKSIPVGEKVELTYNVIASSNADADLYQLDLILNYENTLANTITTVKTIAGIYVGGGTDFDVVFSEESTTEKSFTVSNIGSNTADSVTVKIPTQNGWKTSAGSSQIIGNLEKGDYTTVSFPVTQTGSNNILNLLIEYTNTLGERENETKSITFDEVKTSQTTGENVVGNQRTGGPGNNIGTGLSKVGTYFKYIGISIILLIVGIFGFRTYLKSKKKR